MIGTRAILLAVLALALGALRVGYGWGRGAQADRVTLLTRDNATLQGQLESASISSWRRLVPNRRAGGRWSGT